MSEETITDETIIDNPISEEVSATTDGDSGQEAVQPQGVSNDNSVPYQRFKEVNEARKLAEDKLRQAEQVFSPAEDVNPTVTNGKPTKEQFGSDAEYYEALGIWGGQQGFQDAKTKEEQQQREYEANQRALDAESNFAKSAHEASKKYTNFKEALSTSTTEFNSDVSLAIQASPVAGDLAYALATNPTEAERISKLPTNQALVELGKLSAQIPGSNGQPKKMSNMPSPINPVGTGRPSAAKSYSDDMDQGSFNDAFPFEDLG